MKVCQIAVLGVLFLFLAGGLGFSQSAIDMDEDDFFGSGDVEAAEGEAEVKNIEAEIDKEMVGLSGNLEASSSYTMTRDFFYGLEDINANALSFMVIGDFLIDIRLKKGFRAFVDLNLGAISGNPNPAFNLKEIFVDFNIANVVYFRAGKQVLQWGRGYFWNPTDLINVDRKNISNMSALRDGVFGLKTDFVFAREFHLYTFLDLNGAEKFEDMAFAARAEFLAGTVEFGVSSWLKYNKIPVFGADISLPLFWDISMTAEASFSWGANRDKLDTDGTTVIPVKDTPVPKVAVGFMKAFDFMDVDDRIRVNAEFYYNHAGYDDNMFEVLAANPNHLLLADFAGNYYKSGDYGRFYGALFVTINEFIRRDMSLTLSGMGNFSDLSFIAMAGLNIVPVDNFTLSFTVTSYIGPNFREYTLSMDPATGSLGNNMLSLSVGAKVAF